LTDTNINQKVVKPWGAYQVLHVEAGFQVKRIEVNPHSRLSLQTHTRRAEKWTVVKGTGLATLKDQEIAVKPGSVIDVAVGDAHRMANTGKEMLIFVEVQLGDYLGEDDIVRLQDDYNRKDKS